MKKDQLQPGRTGIWIRAVLLGTVITLLCVFVFAAVLLFSEADRALAAPFATVCLAVGTLCASFYAAKKIGDRGYLVGLLTGGGCFIVVFLISLIVSRGQFSGNTLFHLIVLMLSGLIGGILGVNRAGKKKYI